MLGRSTVFAVGAVIAGLLLPAQAMAQYDARTRADLNLRVGPGTQYGVIDVIPHGDPVDVFGCLDEFAWCDVEWYGLRGWVSARYLVQPGTTVYLPQVAPRIGVPIITFSFGTYHDRYYRDRPWYRERHGRWRGRDWRDRRDGGDRDRDGRREQTEERQEQEQPRRQREAEEPRRQREAEEPRRQREAEEPRRQREAEQPRRQREAEEPRRQRQAEEPRREERTQGQGRDRPSAGERSQRSGSGRGRDEDFVPPGQDQRGR